MNNKLDLRHELIKGLRTRGLIPSLEVESILHYYLEEDLNAVLGKMEFDVSPDNVNPEEEKNAEIELTRLRDGMYISTIFGYDYRVIYRYNGMDVLRAKVQDRYKMQNEGFEKVFDITAGPDNLVNTIISDKDGKRYEQVYEAKLKDSTFSYKCGTDTQEDYSACLIGLNTKFGSYEMLNYIRTTPPKEDEKSILRRIAQTFSRKTLERGSGIINIVTSNSLTELAYYSDRIFKLLKDEAEKIINESNQEKALKMQNEEI